MKRFETILIVVAIAVTSVGASAQGGLIGPDVIVGGLPDIQYWGTQNSRSAYSIATTSCNIGDVPLSWIANTNAHPVIGQNMFRLANGRIEHIGQSWLKHGFLALAGNLCGTCTGPGGSQLDPGCSDPYSASLNGSQSGLGPKSQVNASSGFFPYPYGGASGSGQIFKRLQVKNSDMSPTTYPGAQYFIEGHYIAADDTASGNDDNNASYCPINLSPAGVGFTASIAGPTVQQQPAIFAWQTAQPTVQINTVDVPNDGRFLVGFDVVQQPNGSWAWEFAVQNLNSHRSANSFTASFAPGATVTGIGFHDVEYHSGDGEFLGTSFDGSDWTSTIFGNSIQWSTAAATSAPNGNALRWGTLYNFRFITDVAPPATIPVSIGLYRLGSPSFVQTTFTVTPNHSVALVSGDNQYATVGEAFPQSLVVNVTDNTSGAAVPGVSVNFTGTGNLILSASNAITDANGDASVQVLTGNLADATESVSATAGTNTVSFSNLYTRGLKVTSTPTQLVVGGHDTPQGSPAVPWILMAGTPFQPPYPTLAGDLALNPFDVLNTVVFCDGTGLFGYVQFQWQFCNGTPSIQNTYTLSPPGAFTGQTLAFQGIAVNPGLGGLGIWFTNVEIHTFN